ncbi:MAG: hypothetical protein WBP22_00850 [Candidatus Saccharimonas sp.]
MTDNNERKPFWQRPGTIIPAVAVLIALVAGFIAVTWVNGINNDAFGRQRDVITKYQALETQLSTCLDNSMTAAGIAQQERNSLRDILIGTASARYQNADGTVNTGIPEGAGIAFSAIQEAYPTVSNELYRQLMTTAIGCRNQVTGVQQDLQALGGRFDTWTQTGGIVEKMIRDNYPDERLAVIGPDGERLLGKEALDFIVTPISTADAKTAMTSKELPSQNLFPSAQPTG